MAFIIFTAFVAGILGYVLAWFYWPYVVEAFTRTDGRKD